jgi:pyruvate kinase
MAAGDETTTLTLEVQAVSPDTLTCAVTRACTLPSHLDMTVHGSGLHNKLPILCQDDKDKIRALCKPDCHVQYLCLAYCRSAADIAAAQHFLDECASV